MPPCGPQLIISTEQPKGAELSPPPESQSSSSFSWLLSARLTSGLSNKNGAVASVSGAQNYYSNKHLLKDKCLIINDPLR